MTTIKDVAKKAGVSFKTVSRVLNNDDAVRASTRERVLAAMAALNYRPNAIARGLRTQRTHTIGFISDEIGTSPYAGQILQSAQNMAWQHGILLFSVNTEHQTELKKSAVEMLLNRQVDGIIYAAMYHRCVTPPDNIRNIPAVLLDCFVEDGSLPSVVPDEQMGGYTAVKHLLEKGYRRIGFLNHNEPVPAATGRLAGYQQALAEFQIAFEPALVAEDVSFIDGGYRAAQQLLNMSHRPEAIFCFNDRMALGTYQAMAERGLSVPGDVAVVGFDDQPKFAAHLRPSLTTVRLPYNEMGIWAVEQILRLIDGQDNSKRIQEKLTCELIIREST
ncbi:MAG: LacI family DNA-binding transcriptional regulator [Anaerolineales bacterium]|nr:LacI family DNA-binding transcriptional regulator [Anaerolineales bacterium]MCB9004613.1 LacI family DNA-binding transcriptional regulator [Ardenticatenaceae bacterium]